MNHLNKRHPNIKPESVHELSLPILKQQRDYYCQHCDKVGSPSGGQRERWEWIRFPAFFFLFFFFFFFLLVFFFFFFFACFFFFFAFFFFAFFFRCGGVVVGGGGYVGGV